jgi:hypothetical protein
MLGLEGARGSEMGVRVVNPQSPQGREARD